MGNVLSRSKREQVLALGRLGWPLRRIEKATGIRRETAGDYLRSAGIVVRTPGSWGENSLAKAASLVTTDSELPDSKAAASVTTGFLLEKAASIADGKRSVSFCDPYRELIELELSRGRNARGIWQDMVEGAAIGSRDTYAVVRRALEAAGTGCSARNYKIFLQGSYGNDTNVWSESDVDVVIRLDSIYYYDTTALNPNHLAQFNATFTPGNYAYSDYKDHVRAALVSCRLLARRDSTN